MSDSLEVVSRKTTGTRESRRMRREGLVPAILYGHGEKCIELATKREALEAVVRHGGRIVELKGAVKTSALLRDLQWDTFGVQPIIKVRVPLELKGECPGQRAGGVVSMLMHEIEIDCTPDVVPEKILVQVGKLELGGIIKMHHLDLPKGAKLRAGSDETVVTCTHPSHKAEDGGPQAGSVEPEVIGRKAAEEGEAETGG